MTYFYLHKKFACMYKEKSGNKVPQVIVFDRFCIYVNKYENSGKNLGFKRVFIFKVPYAIHDVIVNKF